MTCENCGLPDWASESQITLRLKVKGDKWKRDSSRTVWCCSEACKWQVLAVAQMGSASHKWPIPLAEFIRLEKRSDRYETHPENTDSKEVADEKIELSGNGPLDGGFVTNRGGRPRQYNSAAERQKAYRRRQGVL